MSARARSLAAMAASVDVQRVAYSVKEVAVAMGIGYDQALAMMHSGEIPYFRAGREFRVYVEDLHAALRKLSAGAA